MDGLFYLFVCMYGGTSAADSHSASAANDSASAANDSAAASAYISDLSRLILRFAEVFNSHAGVLSVFVRIQII